MCMPCAADSAILRGTLGKCHSLSSVASCGRTTGWLILHRSDTALSALSACHELRGLPAAPFLPHRPVLWICKPDPVHNTMAASIDASPPSALFHVFPLSSPFPPPSFPPPAAPSPPWVSLTRCPPPSLPFATSHCCEWPLLQAGCLLAVVCCHGVFRGRYSIQCIVGSLTRDSLAPGVSSLKLQLSTNRRDSHYSAATALLQSCQCNAVL